MRPTVMMKAAMTLDGQLAAADGTSQWISTQEARRDSHGLRAEVDAVMVGAGTVRADDPRLTVRLDGGGWRDGDQPTPVIVAGRQELPPCSNLFGRDPIVLAPAALDVPGRVIVAPDDSGDRVDLATGLGRLGALGVGTVIVEGGALLFRSLLDAGLVDRGVLYYGPMLAGGVGAPLFRGAWNTLADARPVRVMAIRRLGESIRVDIEMGRR